MKSQCIGDSEVDRCHDLFIFGEHVRTEFQDFLEDQSFSRGGTALSRTNVLSVADDGVLLAPTADAANFFRLGDALPVLAQVVDEGARYISCQITMTRKCGTQPSL